LPFLSAWYAATRPPRVIPPEGGAGEAREASSATTSAREGSTGRRTRQARSGDEHDLADVAPLGDHRLRGAGALEGEVAGNDRFDGAVVEYQPDCNLAYAIALRVVLQIEQIEGAGVARRDV
jgi:hypothetical protein